MYKMEDILAQLNSGMSATDIATNFTEALNGAIKAQETAQAEKAQKQEKLADAQKIADAMNAFATKYYGVESTIVDGKTVIDTYEMMNSLVTSFEDLGNGFKFSMTTPTTSSKKAYKEPKAKTADDVFSKFLKINGLL